MLMIRVSEVPAEGLTIEGAQAPPAPFADPAWRLDGLSLRIERDGVDVLVRGQLHGRIPQTCGRCLEPFVVHVAPRIDSRFVPKPQQRDEVELGADDLDVDFYSNDSLDLAALLETEATLALPMKPLCRGDCQGLCSGCGGNRNLTDCGCERRPPDSPFAVLEGFPTRASNRTLASNRTFASDRRSASKPQVRQPPQVRMLSAVIAVDAAPAAAPAGPAPPADREASR